MITDSYYSARLTEKQFDRLSDFIYSNFGIKMPKNKKIMLEGRLHKRLRENGISDFDTYIDYLFSEIGQSKELVHMVDVVTTNKTDFFREPHHFTFLESKVLPGWVSHGLNELAIWSAGCSTGEEPYTICMMMEEWNLKNARLGYQILATDLSTRVLRHASKAVYDMDRITGIPLDYRNKYFLKSKDPKTKSVRVKKPLRDKIKYGRLNFMDKEYPVRQEFDIVFCRNVLIYFDKETQEAVINKLCTRLKSGGFLFLGHSESINSLNVPLKQIEPTIFQRT